MHERAYISSNLGFTELENFEFENISSSWKMKFLSLSLSLEKSVPSFGSNIASVLSFIEFEFLKNKDHQTQISSSLKFEN